MQIVANDSVETIAFASHKEFGTINISGNPTLSQVAFPGLTQGEGLTVTTNFALTQLLFPALQHVDLVRANNNADSADYGDLQAFID